MASGRFEHQTRSSYGENLFESRGAPANPTQVVAAWAAEITNYDYRSNTCRGTCGHYTQLVWSKTREVGCADVRGALRQVVACEYDPPGNWRGERPW
jgi:pathogenesis-related protein 1